MIILGFSDEMIELLSFMKGKTLKSVECVFNCETSEITRLFKMNYGKTSILVSNDTHPMQYGKSIKLCTYYSVKNVKDYRIENAFQYLIDEKISQVVLVRDCINIDNDLEIEYDEALIIVTSDSVYSFAKQELNKPHLKVSAGSEIKNIRKPKLIKMDFSDSERKKIALERRYIFL